MEVQILTAIEPNSDCLDGRHQALDATDCPAEVSNQQVERIELGLDSHFRLGCGASRERQAFLALMVHQREI